MDNKNRHWKTLNSSYLHKKPWCTLRVDHVQLPTGVEMLEYYIHEYPNWVNVLAITKEQKFILVKQYRHGLKIRTYELPAGVCDDTDTNPMESAKRELLEETGYGNGEWKEFTVVSANPGNHTNLCYCYLAINVEKIDNQHLEDTEDLEVVELALDEVKCLLVDDTIKQAMHTTPLWKYMAVNNIVIE